MQEMDSKIKISDVIKSYYISTKINDNYFDNWKDNKETFLYSLSVYGVYISDNSYYFDNDLMIDILKNIYGDDEFEIKK